MEKLDINKELNDFLRNGRGNRSEAQVLILETYQKFMSDFDINEVLAVTNGLEIAYYDLSVE